MIIINNSIIHQGDHENITLDNGLFFGKALFETFFVQADQPEFLNLHLGRLNSSLHQMGIDQRISAEEILNAIQTFKQNGLTLQSYALKLTVSEKNIIYSYREIPYTKEHYNQGFKLMISPIMRNPSSPLTYFKSCNYLDNIFAREQAIKKGFQDAIFLNTDQKVTETSIANLFWIKDNIIYTPHIACGLLNGIIRQVLIHNHNVIQSDFPLDFLMKADHIYLTNSLLKIMPVCQIEQTKFEINQELLNLF